MWRVSLPRDLSLWRITTLALAVGAVLTCNDAPFEPGMEVGASLDIQRLLAAAQSTPIPIDSLVVELRRVSDSTVAFSKTISVDSIHISADGDTVSVDIVVSLKHSTEEFYLYLAVVGDGAIWFEVRDVVSASAGGEPTSTAPLQPVFVGPGVDATSVVVSLGDTTITGADSLLLSGTVYREQTVIDGAAVWFESSDTSLVPKPRQAGRNQAWVKAPAACTDSVTVTAVTLTGSGELRDSGILRFFARPTQFVAVSGNGQEIAAGANAPGPIIVQVLDAAGDPFNRGFPVRFAVASGPAGTTVTPESTLTDAEGFAQATITAGGSEGAITVTATAAGLSGSPVTFNATAIQSLGPVAMIIITPDSAVVTVVGDSVRYTATCRDSTGTGVGCGTVSWMSLAPAVASFDTAAGYAHALGAGVAGIVAATNGVADTAQFVVNGIGSLTVSPADTVITAIGDTVQLSVSGELVLGGVVDIPNDTVVWQTLTPAVALVDSVGNARIVGAGNGTIRATLGTASGTALLRVQQSPASFAVVPDSALIGVGGAVNLSGYTYDRRGYRVPGRSLTWVSRDIAVATVDANGRVTGVVLGSVYIVGNDSTLTDSARVDVVAAPPQVIQWGADSISVGRGATLQQALLLSVPAPANGVTVSIVSSDTLILKPTTPTVVFSSGQTSRTVTFEGRAAGRARVTATDQAAVFAPDTLTVGVLSTLEFRTVTSPTVRATSFSINSAESRRIMVFLSDPAPPGGLAVNIETTNDLVAIGVPSTAVIPGGQLSVEIDLKGTGVGSATLTPTAAGFVGLSSTVYTALAQFSVNVQSYPYVGRLGVGQEIDMYVSVPNAMDRETHVRLTSTTPGVGLMPDSLVILANRTYEYFTYRGQQTGFDTVTANKSGWGEGRLAMLVTRPVVRPDGVGTQTAGGPAVSWYVRTLDSTGYEHRRFDTLTVALASRNSAVMAVDIPTALVRARSSSAYVGAGLRPVGAGTTYLVASAAGHKSDSVAVTVQAPKLSVSLYSPARTGTRQTLDGTVQLPFTVASPITVYLQSVDVGVATVPDSVVIPANTWSRNYVLSGVDSGTTSVIASAVGYEPDTVNVTVTTSRLMQTGLSTSYYITVGSYSFRVQTTDLYGYVHPTLDTVVVTLETTNAAIFTVDSATVTVLPGQSTSQYSYVRFHATGQAWLRWSAPNYPTDSVSVTVNPSALTVYHGYNGYYYKVGAGQYDAYQQMQIPSPNGLTDTTYVQLSHLGTVRGAVPDTVKIPPGYYYSYFRWDGLEIGYDTIIAEATNFVPDTAWMLVTRPWLFASNLPSGVVVNDTLSFTVWTTDSLAGNGSSPYSYSTHPVIDTLPVTVTSTDTTVLAVDSTSVWRVVAGSYYTTPRLIVRGPGTAQVIVSAPGPYKPDTTNLVVATAPALTITPSSITLGTGQQYRYYYVYIPNGVADTTLVTLSVSDTSVAGFSTNTIDILPGHTSSSYFAVYGKNTVASVQITATAPGFTQGTGVVIVNKPQLRLYTNTTGYVGGPSTAFSLNTADETGSDREVWNALSVTFTSTNTNVLRLDSSTVTVQSGTYYAEGSWTAVAAGTAHIIATAPGYKPDTSDVVTIQTPQLSVYTPSTLGVGQREEYAYVSMPFAVAPGDTVVATLGNSAPSVLTVPDTVAVLPYYSYAYFRVVGAGLGTAAIQATADGFSASVPDTTVVGTPLLYVGGTTGGTVGSYGSIYVYTFDQASNSRQVNQALTVTLTVSDPAIANFGGQAQTTVQVAEGNYSSGYATLDFVSAGNVTVTATATGYTNGNLQVAVSQ